MRAWPARSLPSSRREFAPAKAAAPPASEPTATTAAAMSCVRFMPPSSDATSKTTLRATQIGICEDDAGLRSVLTRALTDEGFEVRAVARGGPAVQEFSEAPPDLLVLDVGLPDADGRDVCQALRAHGVDAPVIFLTARGQLTDRLSGFHAGGDDYLTKPFALAELLVRVHALLRRAEPAPRATGGMGLAPAAPARCGRGEPAPSATGGMVLDPAEHAIVNGGAQVALTPTEFRLLAALAAAPGRLVQRASLMAAGWPEGAIVHDNTLDAYVARIRRKLRQAGAPETIATTRGVGYRLG